MQNLNTSPEAQTRKDIDRVGLSEESRMALDALHQDGYFKDLVSAYRLAVSFAITKELNFLEHNVERMNQSHMYLISQVDPHGAFATTIEELYPDHSTEKYRLLEKLADLGSIGLLEHVSATGSLVFWE